MMTLNIFEQFWYPESDNFKGLCKVIDLLKSEIEPDMLEDQHDTPNIQITISVNKDCTTWSYQSGDNSFTGSCYGDPYWGVGYVMRDYKSEELANDLIRDLADQIDFE